MAVIPEQITSTLYYTLNLILFSTVPRNEKKIIDLICFDKMNFRLLSLAAASRGPGPRFSGSTSPRVETSKIIFAFDRAEGGIFGMNMRVKRVASKKVSSCLVS